MSQFVNFKKRGFTLPPGCKNLIDVLKPTLQQGKAGFTSEALAPFGIQKERFPSSGLAEIERFVERLFHPRGEAFVVEIAAQALSSPIMLFCSKTERQAGIVLEPRDVPQEEAARGFFQRRGTEPLLESGHEGTPTLLYRLPRDVGAASALVRELIQEVFALGSDAGLDFEYYDIIETPG
ncbi:MAG TPA: hypothetical protein VFE51_15400 [Verrucomicrobiae bacterium]|nr:hypothetical protein [Verrucomicrobiae bacterium]